MELNQKLNRILDEIQATLQEGNPYQIDIIEYGQLPNLPIKFIKLHINKAHQSRSFPSRNDYYLSSDYYSERIYENLTEFPEDIEVSIHTLDINDTQNTIDQIILIS